MSEENVKIEEIKALMESKNKVTKKKKKSKTDKAKPKQSYASVAETVDLSRATGLPKGPGSVKEQNKIVKDWIARGHKFLPKKLLNTHYDKVKDSLVKPTKASHLKKIAKMVELLHELTLTYVTAEHLIMLSQSPRQKLRKYYYLVCSLYGNHMREQNKSKAEAFTAARDDDTKKVKVAKEELISLLALKRKLSQKLTAAREEFRNKWKNELDAEVRIAHYERELREIIKASPEEEWLAELSAGDDEDEEDDEEVTAFSSDGGSDSESEN